MTSALKAQIPSLAQVQAWPLLTIKVDMGQISNRERGTTADKNASSDQPTWVLLHGIGSNSGSWIAQLQGLAEGARILAWDAPGYGQSTPLSPDQPSARDYGEALWSWLDALGINGAVHLVGHSLGALMAAAGAKLEPQRVHALTLLAPAQGYARELEVGLKKTNDRLQLLASLGAQEMALQRARALLSPHADSALVDLAQHMMASIHARGYTQAAHMLCHGDTALDLHDFRTSNTRAPLLIACGNADTITPPAGARQLAELFKAQFVLLGDAQQNAGHLCALEASKAVNALLNVEPESADRVGATHG